MKREASTALALMQSGKSVKETAFLTGFKKSYLYQLRCKNKKELPDYQSNPLRGRVGKRLAQYEQRVRKEQREQSMAGELSLTWLQRSW